MMRCKIIMIALVLSVSSSAAKAQKFEIEQLLLNVEKLAQFKQILQDMKDGYEILAKGYNTIKDLSEGNFNLHDAFLSGLLEISPPVRNYKKITEVVEMQLELMKLSKGALRRFQSSDLFNDDDLKYLGNVYNNLLQNSLRNLEDLATVITAGQLRMSDEERLQMIDHIHREMTEKLAFVRYFNEENAKVLIGKARENKDARILEKMSLEK